MLYFFQNITGGIKTMLYLKILYKVCPYSQKNQECVLTYFALVFSLLHVNYTCSSFELQFITKYLK